MANFEKIASDMVETLNSNKGSMNMDELFVKLGRLGYDYEDIRDAVWRNMINNRVDLAGGKVWARTTTK